MCYITLNLVSKISETNEGEWKRREREGEGRRENEQEKKRVNT